MHCETMFNIRHFVPFCLVIVNDITLEVTASMLGFLMLKLLHKPLLP
jgi:hypothetical protein